MCWTWHAFYLLCCPLYYTLSVTFPWGKFYIDGLLDVDLSIKLQLISWLLPWSIGSQIWLLSFELSLFLSYLKLFLWIPTFLKDVCREPCVPCCCLTDCGPKYYTVCLTPAFVDFLFWANCKIYMKYMQANFLFLARVRFKVNIVFGRDQQL